MRPVPDPTAEPPDPHSKDPMRALPLLAALATATAFGAFASTTVLPAQDTAEATTASKQLSVRVLYAGDRDHPRTEQWKEFLGSYFTKVEVIQLDQLSKKATEGFDVVIVDSPSPYKPNRKFKVLPGPTLSEDYDRPTILMGAAGGAAVRPAKCKITWL